MKNPNKRWYLVKLRDEIGVRPYKTKHVITSTTQQEIVKATLANCEDVTDTEFPALPYNQYRIVLEYFIYNLQLAYINASDKVCLMDKGLEVYWKNKHKGE